MATETEPLWWRRGVVYQIYPRSFQDSNGDGIGDLAGIIERADYLESLGVDAVWLSPFYPSPMADFGYDVSDYTDVNPIFGDLATFDELLRQLHDRDIRVIVDLVPNHSSSQHPWFVESRSSRDNPKRDWYVWRDAAPGGGRPNNWLSIFGGPAWEWDEKTRQYYLHSFLKEQPDLNWRNPVVKEAMLGVMRFWLERGVDGFRIDVAHMIMKDPDLRDNPPNPNPKPMELGRLREYDTQLHLYDKAHADVHEAFRTIRHVLDEYGGERPRVAIGEIYELDWPMWAGYYGAQLDELSMPFNFALIFAPWNAVAVRQVVDAVEAVLPEDAQPNYVLGNHDQHRVASRVGSDQARVAMMLLLTLRGTPTLYYGDEIGMHDVPIPPEQVHDPVEKHMPGQGFGRDPERTPMQWDPGPNAGFCPPGATPWLPIADDYREINVEVEERDERSMLSLTRQLLALRRDTPALNLGSYRPVDQVPDSCFVYLREAGDRRMLVALNLTADQQTLRLHKMGRAKVLISTLMNFEGPVDLAEFALRPNEGCVMVVG